MEDQRLLYDAFKIYYDKGIEALKTNRLEVARRNLYAASETILKLAKSSNGTMKTTRLKRAEELFKLAEDIEEKQNQITIKPSAINDRQKSSTQPKAPSSNQSKPDHDQTKFTPVAKNSVYLDDVAGLTEAKDEIRRLIIEPQKYPEIYNKFKKKKGGGILLYGLPGTGKTMIAQAIATEINAKFFAVKCSDIASKWFGDSEQNVKNLFLEARRHPCSIIFFDEFEALGAKRGGASTVMNRLVPELLAQMQGFEKSENTLLVIAATNRPWDIDSAFLRPGRFNTSIYVPLPDYEARKAIIIKQLEGVPTADDIDNDEIVRLTEGFNGSDVVEFCDKLKDYAIARSIELKDESPIIREDVQLTKERIKTSVKQEDLEKLALYEDDLL